MPQNTVCPKRSDISVSSLYGDLKLYQFTVLRIWVWKCCPNIRERGSQQTGCSERHNNKEGKLHVNMKSGTAQLYS